MEIPQGYQILWTAQHFLPDAEALIAFLSVEILRAQSPITAHPFLLLLFQTA
jgi:hypothetical protein